MPDDSYTQALHRQRERDRKTANAHDPCDMKAVISSLITMRKDCNESEWVRETEKWKGNGGELSERERKKERSESELIKMSAELRKEKREKDGFHLATRGWMDPLRSDTQTTCKTHFTGEDAYTTYYVLYTCVNKDYTRIDFTQSSHKILTASVA